jgi:tRNA(Ile)-lysidine synthase
MSDALISVAPVSAETFALLIEKFAPLSEKIAIAVSGGADSTALAYCVQRWAGRPCVALIVDHHLRDESSSEAAQVKAQLENMGIQADILVWQHEKIETRIEAAARQARYRLLIDACQRHGAGDLLIAHHADDQAETVLLRLSKGSGIDGLAAMAAEQTRGNVRLLRPFLSMSKTQLVATCDDANINIVSDPTNASDKFARARLRKVLPLLKEEGLSPENLTRIAAHARTAKDALDFYTKEFLTKAAKTEIGGSVWLDRRALHDVPQAIVLRALTICLRYVHEDDYPPEHDSLTALCDKILSSEPDITRTFYGCILSITADRILILREPASAAEILPLKSKTAILWDKRWLVTATNAQETMIRALGTQPHDIIDRLAPHLRRQIPQGRVRASLPALWQGQDLVAIPSFEEKTPPSMIYKKSSLL